MLAVLFLLTLLVAAVVAPWLGVDTSDSRSQETRPVQGWFSSLGDH